MAYKNNIPQPTDNLSNSQSDLLNNFQGLDSYFSINHFPFSASTANNGKHKFCEMPIGSIPAGRAANEATLYGKSAGSTGAMTEGNLWFVPDNSSDEYQLTRSITSKKTSFSATSGWTFLPGGLLLQYGVGTSTSGGATPNGSISYSVPFTSVPAYSLQLTVLEPTDSRRFIKIATTTLSGFTCWVQDNGGANVANTFYWVAIGK